MSASAYAVVLQREEVQRIKPRLATLAIRGLSKVLASHAGKLRLGLSAVSSPPRVMKGGGMNFQTRAECRRAPY